MTTDKWSDERLDDLATQVRFVATLATQVATHHAEISGLDDDVKGLRDALREAMARMEASLIAVGKTCEEHTRRVERKIDEQATAAAANKWTPTQWVAILGPTLVALIGLVGVLITGGPP